MIMATLSVAITTYDRWHLLMGALLSIRSQSVDIAEVTIVNDASMDPAPVEVMELAELSNVSIINHEENQGLASARNTAINLSSAKYFSFCDDDDQWPDGLAARLVSAMEFAPDDVGMAIALAPEKKQICGEVFDGYPRLSTLIRKGFTPPVGSQIYRTELIRQVGGYRTEVKSGVDHDLWISLARVDPRVAVAWGEQAIVDGKPSRERMTTVEHRRRAGIEESLKIWQPDICEVFGEAFYHHFVKSYRQYLDYSFFVKSIQKGEYFDALKRSILKPATPYELIKRRWDKLRGRQRCTLFPEYRGD